jgi:imidazolonepropionase
MILIRGARQLVTLRGPAPPRRGNQLSDLGIIPDGALLIDGDRIQQIGSTRRIDNLAAARSATTIDVTGKVVLPGFADSHTRLILASLPADPMASAGPVLP